MIDIKVGIALAGKKDNMVVLSLFVLLVFWVAALSSHAKVWNIREYEIYVHTHLNSGDLGNWTHVEKPLFPVFLNDSQVEIGHDYCVVFPLRANHSYHVYCYGEWVDWSSKPHTDYDIYVYDPFDVMEGYHTESAGLPEHLGTVVDQPLFVPKHSGNYTFVVRNDLRESKGSQQATLMLIEVVECDVWNEHYVRGKENEVPALETSWAYEFVTESRHVEVLIRVPEALDMYEARLYLMANPQENVGCTLDGIPLAWEPGLYGNRNGMFGGYNSDSRGYRGVAYASCEFHGEDMFMNFTSPYEGKSLYHLVFIGELGAGIIEYVVKTDFRYACLKPSIIPERVYPNDETRIVYISNSTDLRNATLRYSIDGCVDEAAALDMDILNNRSCEAVIPGQAAGARVDYKVEAVDILENVFVVHGNYCVKHLSSLNLSVIFETICIGDNISVAGRLTPPARNVRIIACFVSPNETRQISCYTMENGTFTASFKTDTLGTWKVSAKINGDELRYESVSRQLTIEVEDQPLWIKYSLYIGGGIGAIVITGVVIYLKKSSA